MRALLIGAGHAHLAVVRHAASLRARGVELCLISPPLFRYSGLATAVLSGALPPVAGEIDVAKLAAEFGVTFHASEVTDIDRDGRLVRLQDGTTRPYDVLSLNIGSQTADPAGLAANANVWTVKPLSRLLDLRQRLAQDMARTGQCPALVVAGTGQAGFEVSAALAGLCERSGVVPRISLAGPTAADAWAPPSASRQLRSELERRGITLVGSAVTARARDTCRLASGAEIACDILVLATGLIAPDLVRRLGLPVDLRGRLLTTDRLQTIGDARVFAAGDCAVLASDRRPCAGVFGVRAAPVLAFNLGATAQARPLKVYRPQSTWLSIMDLGDGTGLALRGGQWWLGRSALSLKRSLDLGFIKRMSASPARASGQP